MQPTRRDLSTGALLGGFALGLLVGIVMALLWPRRPIMGSPPTHRRPADRPLPRSTLPARHPVADIPVLEIDPIQLSRERGQQAARGRRAALGLD
jgi:hypothetical protein